MLYFSFTELYESKTLSIEFLSLLTIQQNITLFMLSNLRREALRHVTFITFFNSSLAYDINDFSASLLSVSLIYFFIFWNIIHISNIRVCESWTWWNVRWRNWAIIGWQWENSHNSKIPERLNKSWQSCSGIKHFQT